MWKKWRYGGVLGGVLWLCLVAFASADSVPQNEPVQASVKMFLNKIYDVNTLDETYKVDGYVVIQWKVPNLPKGVEGGRTYENDQMDKLARRGLWMPAFEFINVVGSPDWGNKRLVVAADGLITYNARFLATFTADMDFRRFPFDRQHFVLELEPFSYGIKQLQFRDITVFSEGLDDGVVNEWMLGQTPRVGLSKVVYQHLSDGHPGDNTFSRVTVDITAIRNPSYYLWSFLLPLALIMGASWTVFWLPSFSERLQTSFTMMLTVVAYSFYTSNILPRLPYTTLIEKLVIIGYGSIFTAVLLIMFAHGRKLRGKSDESFIHRCRLYFPLTFVGVVAVVVWRHLS